MKLLVVIGVLAVVGSIVLVLWQLSDEDGNDKSIVDSAKEEIEKLESSGVPIEGLEVGEHQPLPLTDEELERIREQIREKRREQGASGDSH